MSEVGVKYRVEWVKPVLGFVKWRGVSLGEGFFGLGKPFYALGRSFYEPGIPFYGLGVPFYGLRNRFYDGSGSVGGAGRRFFGVSEVVRLVAALCERRGAGLRGGGRRLPLQGGGRGGHARADLAGVPLRWLSRLAVRVKGN